MSTASIPPRLQRAIVAAVPTAEVPKVIAAWAQTIVKNEATTTRIREQIKARGADGFVRYAETRDFTDDALTARPRGARP
jgi:hypothetical protein